MQLKILGIMQDGGLPHIGCERECCKQGRQEFCASLGILDGQQRYLLECTPDFKYQYNALGKVDEIFITHAHPGHYGGLLSLEKCMLNSNQILVWVMPEMKKFLEENRPWKDLIERKNMILKDVKKHPWIIPFEVEHRHDFTETVGFKIKGHNRTFIFIPDIDNWDNFDLKKEISQVDLAFIDGTFFNGQEINYRDVTKISHPFIEDTMELLKDLPDEEKKKIHFIHFNHTNPVLRNSDLVLSKGFNLARANELFDL